MLQLARYKSYFSYIHTHSQPHRPGTCGHHADGELHSHVDVTPSQSVSAHQSVVSAVVVVSATRPVCSRPRQCLLASAPPVCDPPWTQTDVLSHGRLVPTQS